MAIRRNCNRNHKNTVAKATPKQADGLTTPPEPERPPLHSNSQVQLYLDLFLHAVVRFDTFLSKDHK